jgi:hypothetical protein
MSVKQPLTCSSVVLFTSVDKRDIIVVPMLLSVSYVIPKYGAIIKITNYRYSNLTNTVIIVCFLMADMYTLT